MRDLTRNGYPFTAVINSDPLTHDEVRDRLSSAVETGGAIVIDGARTVPCLDCVEQVVAGQQRELLYATPSDPLTQSGATMARLDEVASAGTPKSVVVAVGASGGLSDDMLDRVVGLSGHLACRAVVLLVDRRG